MIKVQILGGLLTTYRMTINLLAQWPTIDIDSWLNLSWTLWDLTINVLYLLLVLCICEISNHVSMKHQGLITSFGSCVYHINLCIKWANPELTVTNCMQTYLHNKNSEHIFIDREAREIMHLVAGVRPFVCALTVEPFDLRPSSFAWMSTLTLARMAM